MKRTAGFTLIELLVVIAIIAILSGIILVSVSSSRNRGNDAKVQSQLKSSQTHAEVFYSNNADSYGPPGADANVATGSCGSETTMFDDEDSGMAPYGNLDFYPVNTILNCVQNDTAYSLSAKLSTQTNGVDNYWCVDSAGSSEQITISDPATITSADDTCDKQATH